MAVYVTLIRAFQDWSVTLGMLQIEGVKHAPIFTLENPKRDTKIDALIPAGVYTCKPYSSAKYPDVYEICDVPGRTYILIHAGNFEADTTGCVLVGLSAGVMKNQAAVMQSKQAMEELRKLIGDQEFTLRVVDVFA